MANNKVQLSDGTTLMDLTQDTVTPQTLLSGATAHNAAGERIVGAATAGGITSFPMIEEVEANWTAVKLTDATGGGAIQFTSSIILAFIIGEKEAIDQGILFLEVEQDQDFEFCNICNEDGYIHVFDLSSGQGAINYSIMASNVLSSEAIVDATIQSVIYYTTADNFFSK